MKRALRCFRCHKRAGGRRRAIMHVPFRLHDGRPVGRTDEGYKLAHKACLTVEEQMEIRSQREARGFKN